MVQGCSGDIPPISMAWNMVLTCLHFSILEFPLTWGWYYPWKSLGMIDGSKSHMATEEPVLSVDVFFQLRDSLNTSQNHGKKTWKTVDGGEILHNRWSAVDPRKSIGFEHVSTIRGRWFIGFRCPIHRRLAKTITLPSAGHWLLAFGGRPRCSPGSSGHVVFVCFCQGVRVILKKTELSRGGFV